MLQLKELVRPQLRPGTTKTNKIKFKKNQKKQWRRKKGLLFFSKYFWKNGKSSGHGAC